MFREWLGAQRARLRRVTVVCPCGNEVHLNGLSFPWDRFNVFLDAHESCVARQKPEFRFFDVQAEFIATLPLERIEFAATIPA